MQGTAKKKSFWYFCLMFLFQVSSGMKNMSSLLEELKGKSDYRVLPKDSTGEMVLVNVSMFLSNLHAVDETTREIDMDIYLRKEWNDPRLAYSDGPEQIRFPLDAGRSMFWIPDLFFSRSRQQQIFSHVKEDSGMRISQNGNVMVTVRMSMKHTCNFYYHAFPFDEQECILKIGIFDSASNDVGLRWKDLFPPGSSKPAGVTLSKNRHPPRFRVTSFKTEYDQKKTSITYKNLIVRLYMTRLRSHYILLTYIPSLLLVLISCLLFWLPLSAVVERFLFGSLLILGLTQVLTHSQDQAPQIGYIKAIDVWMVSCYLFLCVALLEVILLHLVAKFMVRATDDQIELVSNDELSEGSGNKPAVRSVRSTAIPALRKVDYLLRVFYPASFLLFNIVYWAIYC